MKATTEARANWVRPRFGFRCVGSVGVDDVADFDRGDDDLADSRPVLEEGVADHWHRSAAVPQPGLELGGPSSPRGRFTLGGPATADHAAVERGRATRLARPS